MIELGGGRKVQTDRVDPSVGFETLIRLGDEIRSGDALIKLFATQAKRDHAAAMIRRAVTISDQPPQPQPLIVERLA